MSMIPFTAAPSAVKSFDTMSANRLQTLCQMTLLKIYLIVPVYAPINFSAYADLELRPNVFILFLRNPNIQYYKIQYVI